MATVVIHFKEIMKKGEDIDMFDNSKMKSNDLHIHIYNIIL